MSMRRSSINWWKEKRHTSHSGIPNATRPATAWNGDVVPVVPEKTLEHTLLAVLESDEFRAVIASQLDPTIAKLNHIKASNLNLESNLQAHIEDFQSHVTVSNQHLDTIAEEQRSTQDQVKDIPNLLEPIQELVSLQGSFQAKVEARLNDLFSGQTKLLKSIETRFDELEGRMEEIDGKIDHLEEAIVNADLRSAIRFGELSNELQDRNTLLGDRIWEVQRDLGKKIDGPQRKVLGVCEELGKNVRGVSDSLESVQETMQEELSKTTARIEASEKALQRSIVTIQEKIAGIPNQLEKPISNMTKELEEIRELSSSASASSTSQLESMAPVLNRIEFLVGSTNDISHKLSQSHATTENLEDVQKRIESLGTSHIEKLENTISTTTRLEAALIALEAGTIGKLDGLQSRIESYAAPLSSHSSKLDNLGLTLGGIAKDVAHGKQLDKLSSTVLELSSTTAEKLTGLQSSIERYAAPLSSHTSKLDDLGLALGGIAKDAAQRTQLDELSSTVSDLRSTLETGLSSQIKSLDTIQQQVTSTTSFDEIREELSGMGKSIADQFHELESKQCSALNELGTLKAAITSDVLRTQISDMEKSIAQNLTIIGATQSLARKEMGELKVIATSDVLRKQVSDMKKSIAQDLSIISATQSLALNELGELKATTTSNHQHISDSLNSMSQTPATKEDVASVQAALMQSLAVNGSVLEEVRQFQLVKDLSAKVDELNASTSAAMQSLDQIVHSTATSTVDEIHEHFRGLDGNLDNRFSSMTEAVHERVQMLQGPVAEVLKQVHESEALLKTHIHEQHQTTRECIESGRSSHAAEIEDLMTTIQVIRETNKQDEILNQLGGLGHNILAKQDSNTSTIVGMLDEAHLRDEGLQQSMADFGTSSSDLTESLKMLDSKSLDRHQQLQSLISDSKGMANEISAIMKEVQIDVQHLKEDPTTNNIKQLLLQNASSMATSYEGILAIDTKIETSQNFIHSAVQEMQTTMGRDILDASSSITASVNGNLGEVKVDLASRVSTSTNILRAEMKRIDLSQTAAALDLLKDDIQSTSKMAHEDVEGLAKEIKYSMESLGGSLNEVVTTFGQNHTTKLEENADALSQMEKARLASLTGESARIQELFDIVSETKGDVRMIVSGVQGLEQGSKSSATNVSDAQDLVRKLSGELNSLLGEMKDTIEGSAAGINKAVKDNHLILSKVADFSSEIADIRDGIKGLESSISTASESNKELLRSSIAATTAEILSVKSDIGGVTVSLRQVDEERRETEKVHASILSTVKRTSADLHEIERMVKLSDDASREASAALKQEISTLGGSILDDNARLEGTIVRELGYLPATIEKAIHGVDSTLKQASLEARKVHEDTLVVMKSESGSIREFIAQANEEAASAMSMSLAGIGNAMDSVDSKLTEASLEATRVHGDALAVIKSEAGSIRESTVRAAEKAASLTSLGFAGIEKSVLSIMQVVERSLVEDLQAINSTAKDLRVGLEGISNEIGSMAERAVQNHGIVLGQLRSEARSTCEEVANGARKTSYALEAGQKTILSELESTKRSLSGEVNATHSTIQDATKLVESMSIGVHGGFENVTSETSKTQQAVATLQSETKSMSDALMREFQNTVSNLDNVKSAISSDVQETRRSLIVNITEAQKSVQRTMEHISTNVSTGFSDATSQRRESKTMNDAKLTSVAESINQGLTTTQNRMISELQKAARNLESNLEQLKMDLGSVSKYFQSSNASVKKEIENLSDKTVDGLENLEGSIKNTNAALGRRIGDTESTLQTSFESITGNMKAVDAAVRVNSAAIARVDKAVLETGSQIKGVVLDGNRDMLFQLDEELHENGTRIRGISEFDIPRIEALGKRNRDALEVIGARVLGTAKKFDEMIAHHSPKVLEHSELLNGRLRGGSNASSRDSGLRMSGILER